jgi:hypothetical protein
MMRGLVMGIAIISAGWPFIKALAQDDSDMPKERWGKTVTAESPRGRENQKSDFATIVAPPGFAIALDRLDIWQQCSCNEVTADPKENCQVTFKPNTPQRISYQVEARPTANDSQRCKTTLKIGYFLVKEPASKSSTE